MPLQVSQLIGLYTDTIVGIVFLAGHKCERTQQKDCKCENSFYHIAKINLLLRSGRKGPGSEYSLLSRIPRNRHTRR